MLCICVCHLDPWRRNWFYTIACKPSGFQDQLYVSSVWLDLHILSTRLVAAKMDHAIQYCCLIHTVWSEAKPMRFSHRILGAQSLSHMVNARLASQYIKVVTVHSPSALTLGVVK